MIWIRILLVELVFWGALAIGESSKRREVEAQRDELAAALQDFRARLEATDRRFDDALEAAVLERIRMRPELYGRPGGVAPFPIGGATSHFGGPSE